MRVLGRSRGWEQGSDSWYEITYWYPGFKPRIFRDTHRGRIEYYYTMDSDNYFHRDNGPAIIYPGRAGRQGEFWYLYGKELKPEDFDSLAMVRRMKAWTFLTPVQLAALKEKQRKKS